MALDPRTPVVVGVGQLKQQLDDVAEARPPVLLMEDALRAAAEDAGAPALLGQIERCVVIGGMWRDPDPGRVIADAVGSPNAHSFLSAMGGNMPQNAVSDCAGRVLAGEVDLAVVLGGEAVYSRNKLRKMGADLPEAPGKDLPPAARYGDDMQMSSEHEQSVGLMRPIQIYPLFESAVRAQRGRSHEEHNAYISKLWEGLNGVAVDNPHAWVRTPMTAHEIITPSPSNRLVGYPYTKSMNANAFVDQATAIVVMSVAKAEALGIASDRWVFPLGAADGHSSYLFSERDNYHSSPAIRLTGTKALELAGTSMDEIAHMDLYSCFPSVVQITMDELGIGEDRTLSTTGGLSFFGGPMNNYVLHAIASLVDELRADAGSKGFIHANGGFTTKHSCAVYSTEPPAVPFRQVDVQDEIDQHPTREVDHEPAGQATVEAYTVMHGKEGAELGLLTAIMPDGRRALANTSDADIMAAMMAEEFVGKSTTLSPDGTAQFS